MNGGAHSETLFSVLTPTGRGAVAVVAVQGSQAVTVVDRCFLARNRRSLAEQPISRIVYGHWGSSAGEDLVVCRRSSDHLEIHCHGGSQSVAAVTTGLIEGGCYELSWQDWIRRGGAGSLKVEAQIALAQAASIRTATILLDQFQGALECELRQIRDLLDRNDETLAESRLARLLATWDLGLHLTRPWQVVIAGKPNVGKSSLINALVGYQRAIVFDQPGTTRDVVTASTVIDGWPVVLSDTAGIHDSTDELESAGIELARERLVVADLIVWVVDAADIEGSWQAIVDRDVAELQLPLPRKCFCVLNKIDLINGRAKVPSHILATSAATGEGIERLLGMISETLVPEVPSPGSAVLFTTRQVAAIESVLTACQQGELSRAVETLVKLVVG